MDLKTDRSHDHALRVEAAKAGVSCTELVNRILAERLKETKPKTLKCLDGDK